MEMMANVRDKRADHLSEWIKFLTQRDLLSATLLFFYHTTCLCLQWKPNWLLPLRLVKMTLN